MCLSTKCHTTPAHQEEHNGMCLQCAQGMDDDDDKYLTCSKHYEIVDDEKGPPQRLYED